MSARAEATRCVVAALVGWACIVPHAVAQEQGAPLPPMPEELHRHFEAVFAAERIADPLQRCLAYPDLPGNAWPEGAAAAYCERIFHQGGLALDEFERMLDQPDGASAVEARLAALLDAHFEDPAQRDRIHEFFFQFDADERSGQLATRWMRAAPDSPFAMTALASHRAAMAWDARGAAFIKDTSSQQLKRMEQLMLAAIPLLHEALAREPRLAPACRELAALGRSASGELQWQALDHCVKLKPDSFYVAREMLFAALPKWGGADAAIDVVLDHIREHAPGNPALHALSARAQWERAWEGGAADAGALLAAARIGPELDVLFDAASGTEAWERAVHLTQYIRFQPHIREARHERYAVMWQIEQWDWVMVDLEWLARHFSGEQHYVTNYANLLLRQRRSREAIPYLRAALALPDPHPQLEEFLCSSLAGDPDTAGSDEVAACSASLLASKPTYLGAWHWRASHLIARQDFAALARLRGDLDHVQLDSPPQQRALFIRYIEQYLGDPR